MKRWLQFGLLFLMLFVVSACAGYPAKQDTPFAQYNTLVVRPINWKETITDKLSNADEVRDFMEAQPDLSVLWQTEFTKYINKVGYFDKVLFTADPAPKGALVLEPKIATLDPGIRWVMSGMATYYGVLKTAEGKQIATYTASRRVSRPVTSTTMGAIRNLVTELGEDAASGLPEAH
ncbi:hypothetical protein [Geomonas sp.]|uniref:hypothetical protein n=1 Tax=Geomonas sp. TaxID=2651584 RepID=UPI002B48CA16|nr:hypothetical protein [Geomonas sp.]HJV34730.1 hypothetical protein [Geomonas sp.]